LTAVSAFLRRASAHFPRHPRTGKIATSAITRLYAEKLVKEAFNCKMPMAFILQLSGPKVGAEVSAAVGGVTARLK